MDSDLISEMNEFRDSANSEAHSVEVERTDEEMEEFSRIATNAADTLLYIRRELEISAENNG